MAEEKTILHKRIESGGALLLGEMSPPCGSDPAPVRDVARRYAGRVHALGISDNRHGVCMSALAAASVVAAEGVEPLLHAITRDRNRIALVSDYLGARALGIRNLLCTTGTHQTLSAFRASKNVFDLDSVQLLRTLAELPDNGAVVGEQGIPCDGPVCFGAAASYCADPMEMQVVRAAKKISAGARFLITEPVFDVERFEAWFEQIKRRGLHDKASVVAGIRPLGDAEAATAFAQQRPSPRVPEAMLQRIASKADPGAQRETAVEIAVETIGRLRGLDGLGGFQIGADGDVEAALATIEKSGLGID